MKKVWSMFLLILFCFTSAVAEDDIWVEETWKQIDREVDCDGLPLLIHARVFRTELKRVNIIWISWVMMTWLKKDNRLIGRL